MGYLYHRSRGQAGGVDEGHDLVEAGPVAVGGVDLERGGMHRDPGERLRAVQAGVGGAAGARRRGRSWARCRTRCRARSGSTVQFTIRSWARPSSGSSRGRHTWSWNAPSAPVLTPARTSSASTLKKTGSVLAVSSSPGRATKPGAEPQAAWTMPSLISSRETAGQPTAEAIAWASVVLPDPAGPLRTTSVGSGVTLAVIADCRNVPGAVR